MLILPRCSDPTLAFGLEALLVGWRSLRHPRIVCTRSRSIATVAGGGVGTAWDESGLDSFGADGVAQVIGARTWTAEPSECFAVAGFGSEARPEGRALRVARGDVLSAFERSQLVRTGTGYCSAVGIAQRVPRVLPNLPSRLQLLHSLLIGSRPWASVSGTCSWSARH